jgi:mono/diheme cytochrome c family protein
VSGRYFVGNGTFQSIKQVVTDGVPRPRDYEVPMPPKGGASLDDPDITAVAAYVWAIGHAHR